MKKFFENYGLIAFIAIVIIVLIIMASPFGVSVENGIKSMVGSFSNRVNDSTKHITVIGGESEQEDDKTYALVNGPTFNSKLKEIDAINKIITIEFVDTKIPTSGVTEITGIDADNDGGVVGWYVVDSFDNMANVFISTQKSNQKVIANSDSSKMFDHLIYVKRINVTKLDVSNVTNMSYMFDDSGNYAFNRYFKIEGLDNWNTSNVTNMAFMFCSAGLHATTWSIGDLSNWNTSNVTDMAYMFDSAGDYVTTWSIGDLSNWNVSNVTDMYAMFHDAGRNATTWSIGDLSSWNTSNVTNMAFMFCSSALNTTTWSIGDLSNWNTSNVTTMAYMFTNVAKKANYHLNLSNWNVDKIAYHHYFNDGVESKITPPIWKS